MDEKKNTVSRRAVLAGLAAAGLAYVAPCLFQVNEAMAQPPGRPDDRPGHGYGRDKNKGRGKSRKSRKSRHSRHSRHSRPHPSRRSRRSGPSWAGRPFRPNVP